MEMTINPTQASLTIGDDYEKTNTIKFTITLKGTGKVGLMLQIPVGENGVLRAAEDANNISVGTDGKPEIPQPILAQNSPSNTKGWNLGDPKKGVDVKDSTNLAVSITNILCRASEGTSQITVTGVTADKSLNDKPCPLTITKAKPTTAKKSILYFIAKPTSLIGSGKVTLTWDVVGKQEVRLEPPVGNAIAPATSPYTTDSLHEISAYTLRVGSEESQVTVNVLKEGWHKIEPLGDRAFPSVIFDSGGRTDDALYAIFVRHGGETRRQAVLCRSTDGITGWEVINEAVPDGTESSPGVRLGNRLWLIGGSAVDPETKSSGIRFYDLDHANEGWQDAVVTGDPFEERMGHACVIVNDTTIWVMGGLGKYQCLNDVWSFRIDGKERNKLSASRSQQLVPWWKPRCMFSAVNFNNMIWVCGGVTSPNGNPLGDMWSTDSSKISWKTRPTGGSPSVVANAIGTGAASCGDTLFTVVTNRTGGANWEIKPQMWTIGTRGITQLSDTWSSQDTPGFLPNNKPPTPHSVAVVRFGNARSGAVYDGLYLRALYRDAMYGDEVLRPNLWVKV